MKLIDKLKQPEGRKLEFKGKLSTRSELAKTVIAFANDAGGELYFGVKDASREIVGVNEEDLMGLEEKICNIIHDQCAPIILPEISFHQHRGKYIIKTIVHKGNNPPYYSWKDRTKFRNKFINPLLEAELLAMTEPGKPKSRIQKYYTTEAGKKLSIVN